MKKSSVWGSDWGIFCQSVSRHLPLLGWYLEVQNLCLVDGKGRKDGRMDGWMDGNSQVFSDSTWKHNGERD